MKVADLPVSLQYRAIVDSIKEYYSGNAFNGGYYAFFYKEQNKTYDRKR